MNKEQGTNLGLSSVGYRIGLIFELPRFEPSRACAGWLKCNSFEYLTTQIPLLKFQSCIIDGSHQMLDDCVKSFFPKFITLQNDPDFIFPDIHFALLLEIINPESMLSLQHDRGNVDGI